MSKSSELEYNSNHQLLINSISLSLTTSQTSTYEKEIFPGYIMYGYYATHHCKRDDGFYRQSD